MLTSLFLIPGLAALLAGAGFLVNGASALARRLGVSDLVVGLTIVAFGTSAPEFVVSVFASAAGDTDISVANILGSNTFNILVILGVSALIHPLAVGSGTVWREIPLSLLAAVMVWILGGDELLDGRGPSALTRADGLVLLSFFVIFLYYVFGILKRDPAADTHSAPPSMKPWKAGLWIILGLLALNLGAKLTVDGAAALARWAGVSEWTIGLTVVAAGTSLPELATSAVAAWKRNADLAVGNIVGSNIFNIFCILGVSAVIRPLPMRAACNLDIAATILSSLLLFLFMFVGRRPRLMDRWEGAVSLILYAGYLAFLVVRG